MTTSLKSEDCEAWKHFLKQKNIELALEYCRTQKQKQYVAALHANKMFQEKQFGGAAEYFIKSGLRFEAVCLKYFEADELSELISYLLLVLKKLKRFSAMGDGEDENN